MPSIPIRRDSAPKVTPNEGPTGIAKPSTNMQSLAQAIAARAQHVAAANAQARATNKSLSDDASVSPQLARGRSASRTQGSGRASPTGSMPRSVSAASSDVESEKSDAEDHLAPSAGESQGSTPKAANFKHSKEEQTTTDTVLAKRSNGQQDARRESVLSNESFRWSKGDWAEFAGALSSQVETGKGSAAEELESVTTSHVKFTASDSEHSESTGQTSSYDRHSNTSATVAHAAEERKRGSAYRRASKGSAGSSAEESAIKPKAAVAGLGILGGADLPTAQVVSLTSSFSVIASSSLQSYDSFATAPDSTPVLGAMTAATLGTKLSTPELPFPTTPSSASNSPMIPSPGSGGIKRKSRPAALSLHNTPITPARTPTTASMARSLASPTMGGRTPPPTMPPAEPLPPLPATPSTAFLKSQAKSGSLASPRVFTYSDAKSPLLAAFSSMPILPAQEEVRPRQESDPSPNVQQFQNSPSSSALAGLVGGKHRSSKSASGFGSRSAALVNANHISTSTGAQSAEAVLKEVTPEPSYDEERASRRIAANSSHAAKRSSDPTHSNSRLSTHEPVEASKGADGEQGVEEGEAKAAADAISSSGDSLILPYDNSESEDVDVDEEDEEEEEEEAVVTRVTSINGCSSITTLPKLIRTESAPILTTAKPANAEDGSLASLNIVGRMRARIEARSPKLGDTSSEAVTPARKTSNGVTGPPSAWTNRQPVKVLNGAKSVLVTEPIRSAGASSSQGHVEPWTPSAGTPTLSISHSDYNGFSPVQSRRNEMDEDRSTASPADTVERLKRTEGRFAGAFGEVALAFKQLQAEKRTLEKVIRATTPLEGIGNGEDLSQYLTTMSSKLSMSAQEIRRLLDLLDQQRGVMDYMVETHQLELDAYLDEIDDLKEDFDVVSSEAETHRVNCIRLTEDLDRAHSEAVGARAETLRVKAILADEEAKRDKFVHLLRLARDDLATLEREKSEALQSAREGEGAHRVTQMALEDARSEHAREVDNFRKQKEGPRGRTQAYKPAEDLQRELDEHRAEKAAHTSELQSLRTEIEQLRRGTSKHNDEDRVASLQRELAESKKNQAESERLLQEHKAKSIEDGSIGSLSPHIAGQSEAEELLREKLVQQEKDIAELRAAVALGGGVGGSEETMASLPDGRADQVKILLADLADKRAREVQIRTAYKQLRDELRKLQTAQQQDRKRSQASFSYLSGSTGSSSGHAPPPSSYLSHAATTDSSAPTSPNGGPLQGQDSSTTSRHLKRLSLPLVSKALNSYSLIGLEGAGGHSTTSPSASSHSSRLARRKHSIDAQSPFSLAANKRYSNSEREDDGESHDDNSAGWAAEEGIESLDSPRLSQA